MLLSSLALLLSSFGGGQIVSIERFDGLVLMGAELVERGKAERWEEGGWKGPEMGMKPL